ncbi:MAG: AtpZ/AtpI family protein [Acidobacteria bacterium]|nr:AtpZ/AtpI family protein [Acidobacteriota bacterium]
MNDRDEQQITRKSGVVYAAVFTLVTAVVAFLIIGWLLDRWLKTAPWLLVAGVVVGTVVGFYQFIRIMSRLD